MNKHSRVWSLQEAKAKFSELVRRARSEGPQTVTVHGRDAVIVTSAEAGIAREETGAELVEILNRSPLRSTDMRRVRAPARNRKVAV
jgi:prevent-host-death family protein